MNSQAVFGMNSFPRHYENFSTKQFIVLQIEICNWNYSHDQKRLRSVSQRMISKPSRFDNQIQSIVKRPIHVLGIFLAL